MRAIAFHLPQFHPIPENDEWWGKGFTEWTNVVKAKPRFQGHYQPHLPADLGFYDLRLPEARAAQAELAASYGIHGFCYYHYWFQGRQVLEYPVNEILKSRQPNFPFCLCWANEPWSRRWDGSNNEVLLEQRYSASDDLAHIRALIPFFLDPRYIRIGDRPFFAVYRASELPDPQRTCDLWRREVEGAGLKGLFLVRVESHNESGDPRNIGFDCALEFEPRWSEPGAFPDFPSEVVASPQTREPVNRYSAITSCMSTKILSDAPWLHHFPAILAYLAFALAGTIARGERPVQSSFATQLQNLRAVAAGNREPDLH